LGGENGQKSTWLGDNTTKTLLTRLVAMWPRYSEQKGITKEKEDEGEMKKRAEGWSSYLGAACSPGNIRILEVKRMGKGRPIRNGKMLSVSGRNSVFYSDAGN